MLVLGREVATVALMGAVAFAAQAQNAAPETSG